MYTAVLHLLYSSFRWGSLVTAVCITGRGKKRLKPTGLFDIPNLVAVKITLVCKS